MWEPRPCNLLEVLSVQPLIFDGDKEIYGTIETSDNYGNTYIIFDRPEHQPQVLRPPCGLLTLAGPKEVAIDGRHWIFIRFSLIDKKQTSQYVLPFYLSKWEGYELFPDDELFSVDFDPIGCDKILRKVFTTNCSLWEVKFVPYKHAVQATVRLSLCNWKGERKETVKLCGKVVASNSLLRECAKTILLDSGMDDQPLTVSVGQTAGANNLIPLWRPVAVVPHSSIFKVSANIRLHRDDNDYDGNNFSIVNNTVSFPAALSGEEQQLISGELGDIQITVAWSCKSRFRSRKRS